MPRIKLKPLKHYSFSTDIVVQITDLNYGGHLGNDRMLSLVHEARVRFLKSHGLSESDFGGVSLILADVAIVYQGEAFQGDNLKFEVALGEPSKKGFRMFFRVTRALDQKKIALVENGMVCFDYETKTLLSVPDVVFTLCEER